MSSSSSRGGISRRGVMYALMGRLPQYSSWLFQCSCGWVQTMTSLLQQAIPQVLCCSSYSSCWLHRISNRSASSAVASQASSASRHLYLGIHPSAAAAAGGLGPVLLGCALPVQQPRLRKHHRANRAEHGVGA